MGAKKKKLKQELRTALKAGLVPQYLRVEVKSEEDKASRLNSYVEWHNGKMTKMVKKESYGQVCMYSDLGQNVHNSETRKSLQARLVTQPKGRMYECSKSFVEGPAGEPVIVKVWNEDTPEFESMNFAEDISKMEMRKVLEAVLKHRKEHNKGRGTKQLNILFTGGENQRREEKEILNDYGCAMPAINAGSDEFVSVAVGMSEVAKKVGIRWADRNKLTDKEKERQDLFARKVDPRNCMEGLSLAALEVYPNPESVNEHVDAKNCKEQTEVLTVSQMLWHEEKLYRLSIIGYQRKACHDTIVRRNACKEVVVNTTQYLSSIPTHLLPKRSAEEYVSFYNGMGDLGMAVIVEEYDENEKDDGLREKQNTKVISVALMNRPHVDKPFSYISAVSSAIMRVYEKNKHLSEKDLMMMCLPVGQLNGMFPYLSVLHTLAKLSNVDNTGPLGIMDIIIAHLIALTGSYSGGSLARNQVSWRTEKPDEERTLGDIEVIGRLCSESSDSPPFGTAYSTYCAEEHLRLTQVLRRRVYGVGELGAQHLLVVLVHVGLLKPEGMVQCAQFATGTTTLKKGRREVSNPAMIAYLDGAGHGTGDRSSRARRVLESVMPHFHMAKKNTWITAAILEQSNCEMYRNKVVADFHVPGGSNYWFDSCDGKSIGRFWELKPKVDVSTKNVVVEKKARRLPELRTSRVSLPNYDANVWTKECGTMRMCRVPWEQIQAHSGLDLEIQQRVFGSSFEDTCSWVENHGVLQKLIKDNLQHPQPMPKAQDSQTTMADVGLEEEEADEGSMDKARKSTECVLEGNKSVETEKKRKKTITFSDTAVLRLYKPGSCPMRKRTSVHSVEKVSVIKRSSSSIVDHGIADGVDEIWKEASFDTKATREEETMDATMEEEFSAGRTLLKSSTVVYYRFLSHQATKVINGWKPLQSTKLKNILNLSIRTVRLGSIYSELKRCIYSGVSEREMPLDLQKRQIVPRLCTEETHELASSEKMYGAEWKSHEDLQFFTVGHCTEVDFIARFLGATKATNKVCVGETNWMFKSFEDARYHLFVCMMVLAGKRSYFEHLYNRIIGHNKKRTQDEETSRDQSAAFEVVRVEFQDKDIGTFMYAVVSRNEKVTKGQNKWALTFTGPHSKIIDKRTLVQGIWFDVWSWKKTEEGFEGSKQQTGSFIRDKKTAQHKSANADNLDELSSVFDEKNIFAPSLTRRRRKRLKQEFDSQFMFTSQSGEINLEEVQSGANGFESWSRGLL